MSRRALLATGGLTLAGACIGVAALPDDRDANLLALLAEFERLEAEIYALGAACETVEDEAAIDAARDRLIEAQDRLYAPIVATRAQTLAGIQARARNLPRWAPHLLVSEPGAGWDHQFTAALLRDLIALPG